MLSREFTKNQEEYHILDNVIIEYLASHIADKFSKYVLVAETSNEPVAKAIAIKYREDGWDVKIDDDMDYHNLGQYGIYIKLKKLGRE